MIVREAAILLFALFWPTVMTWLYFVVLAGEGKQGNPALLAGAMLGKLIQFAFPLLIVGLVDQKPLRWPAWNADGMALGLSFGVLAGVGILGLYYFWLRGNPILGTMPERLWSKLTELHASSPFRYLLLAAALSVVHSLLEEYYWRWFTFGRLFEDLKPSLSEQSALWLAIVVSSLAFMSHHIVLLGVYFAHDWTLALRFSLGVALGGGVWAWLLYQNNGNIYAPWFSHLIVDAAIMWVGYDIVRQHWK